MRVEVRGTNVVVSEEARQGGERRALFAFGRFASRLRSVSVVLTDVNGPRGGLDTACRIRVKSRDGWTLTVSSIDHDLERAMTSALGRAGRAVARQIDRQNDNGAREPRGRQVS